MSVKFMRDLQIIDVLSDLSLDRLVVIIHMTASGAKVA